LKARYNSECDKWMINHPGQRISQYDLVALFGAAFLQAANVQKAVNGFNAAGIWPFNPDRISPERYVAAEVTEEPPPVTVSSLPLLMYILRLYLRQLRSLHRQTYRFIFTLFNWETVKKL